MIIHTIYKFVNTINGKVYIGFDSKWPNRIVVHKSSSKNQDTKFYRAIRKYGWDKFEYSVLYQSYDKDHTLKVMENYFINEYDSFHNGYNSTLGGDGTLGRKRTLEERIKQSISTKGKPKPQTAEHVKNRINSKKKNLLLGITMPYIPTEEHRKKISIKTKGVPKPMTDEHKKNLHCHINNSKKVECPHCKKVGQLTNMKRWHFDKCKSRPQAGIILTK
jgi:group I intron endonuclease